MKHLNKSIFLSFLALLTLLFVGCASTRQGEVIKQTEYVYIKQPLNDSLQGRGDTVISFQKVFEHDTVFTAKYYPKYKTLTVKSKPDTIRIKHTDTLTVNKTEIKKVEMPWTQRLGIVFIGVIVGAGLCVGAGVWMGLKGVL